MQDRWPRTALVELVGVFGLVFFSAGVVCVNQMTTPTPGQAGTAPLTLHQPGLFGIALAQATILAVLLAVTVPVSGGYLNPAVTVTLWALGRVESARAGVLLGAQLVGSVLGASCLRLVFQSEILQTAQFGAPHVNPLAYPFISQHAILAGSGIELLLTFFLVFAMFALIGPAGEAGGPHEGDRPGVSATWASLIAGMVQAAAVLFAFPLTGAALNPARWFGPVLWESVSGPGPAASAWTDFLVYLSGPILGALLAGLFCARVYAAPETPTGLPPRSKKAGPT